MNHGSRATSFVAVLAPLLCLVPFGCRSGPIQQVSHTDSTPPNLTLTAVGRAASGESVRESVGVGGANRTLRVSVGGIVFLAARAQDSGGMQLLRISQTGGAFVQPAQPEITSESDSPVSRLDVAVTVDTLEFGDTVLVMAEAQNFSVLPTARQALSDTIRIIAELPPQPTPVVTDVDPDGALPLDLVDVKGRNLDFRGTPVNVVFRQGGATRGTVQVSGPSANALSNIELPEALVPGPAELIVGVHSLSSAAFGFTVGGLVNGPFTKAPTPSLASPKTCSGPQGSIRVTIADGTNFSTDWVAVIERNGSVIDRISFNELREPGHLFGGTSLSADCQSVVVLSNDPPGHSSEFLTMVYHVPTDDIHQIATELRPPGTADFRLDLYNVLFSPDGKVLLATSVAAASPRDLVANAHDLADDSPVGSRHFDDCAAPCTAGGVIESNRDVVLVLNGQRTTL